ncbi:MAG TPA: hypothetical protein VN228_20020, partial [Pyrinomonadaceae bacterium]|nr:hypothetical protein [Pyrinomonadaceae bacterium]
MKRFLTPLLTAALALTLGLAAVSAQNKSNEADADIPPISQGKVEKRTYMRLRAEHVAKLRGLDKNNLDKSLKARANALEKLERQEREKKQKQSAAAQPAADSNAAADSAMQASADGMMSAAAVTTSWTPIGPAPIANGQTFSVTNSVSGRVTAIAINPSNPNVVYVGTALGGVFRTLNGGGSWTPITDGALSLAVGAIAIDPSNPTRVYVGTGEANYGQRNYFGVGVYRIENAESEEPTRTLTRLYQNASGADVFTGRAISKIL